MIIVFFLNNYIKMSLELLIGPMFAGKSSAIQSIVRRHQALEWPTCVITHVSDNRYTEQPSITNHDKISIPALATNDLDCMKENLYFKQARLVVIEEGQFFTNLVPFVLYAVETLHKNVVVVGLDGDALRRPFGSILELIPYCDKVTKLTAMCKLCKDGTPALFTHAYSLDACEGAKAGVPCVGAEDKYVPLCRKHFLLENE
jgi:thymidine kinase